jgi:hypothetical protein
MQLLILLVVRLVVNGFTTRLESLLTPALVKDLDQGNSLAKGQFLT